MTKIDISTIKAREITVEITHPGTGEGLGLIFKQVPRSDPRVKIVDQRLRDMMLQQRARNKIMTAVQLDQNAVRLICASVTGWDWAGAKFDYKGNKEFSEQSLIEFFDENPWARDQLDESLGDDARFFRN